MKPKILVVEDGLENLATARALYTTKNEFDFDYARDYDEAKDALEQKDYSGIVTDCFMPRKIGSRDISLGMGLVDKLTPYAAKNVTNPRELMIEAMNKSEAHQPLGIIIVDYAQEHQIPCFMLTTRHDDFGDYIIRRWCIANAIAWSNPREGEKSDPNCNSEGGRSWGVALKSVTEGISNGYQAWRQRYLNFFEERGKSLLD